MNTFLTGHVFFTLGWWDSLVSSMYSTFGFPGGGGVQHGGQARQLHQLLGYPRQHQPPLLSEEDAEPLCKDHLQLPRVCLGPPSTAQSLPGTRFASSTVFMLVLISDFAIRYGLGYNLGKVNFATSALWGSRKVKDIHSALHFACFQQH